MNNGPQKVTIAHLGTGIINIRRVVTREEIAAEIDRALQAEGLSNVQFGDRPLLRAQIVSTLLRRLFDQGQIEVYRQVQPGQAALP